MQENYKKGHCLIKFVVLIQSIVLIHYNIAGDLLKRSMYVHIYFLASNYFLQNLKLLSFSFILSMAFFP